MEPTGVQPDCGRPGLLELGGHPVWVARMTNRQQARDSQSGEYVSKDYADANPATTQLETDTTTALKLAVLDIVRDEGLSAAARLSKIEELLS